MERPGVNCIEDTQEASMTQLRESREQPGSAREVRDHCHGDSVYLQTTGHSFLSAIDGTSWLQSAIPEVGMLVDLLLSRLAQVPEIDRG